MIIFEEKILKIMHRKYLFKIDIIKQNRYRIEKKMN